MPRIRDMLAFASGAVKLEGLSNGRARAHYARRPLQSAKRNARGVLLNATLAGVAAAGRLRRARQRAVLHTGPVAARTGLDGADAQQARCSLTRAFRRHGGQHRRGASLDRTCKRAACFVGPSRNAAARTTNADVGG